MSGKRNYGFFVDSDMEAAMEADRAELSEQLGVALNVSQYMRYVFNERIQAQPPPALGYREGALAAYAEVRSALDTTMGRLIAGTKDG